MDESSGHCHQGAVPAGRRTASDDIWLAATWPFIRSQLPPPPARVIELGCGRAGGHIPALIQAGYDATGVDPEAPEGAAYRQAAFEDYWPEGAADAVIASVSLHHVEDPGVALDHVAEVLSPDGTLIVIEWISEDFDEATARWCFGHQPRDADDHDGWLTGLHAQWTESGLSWDEFFGGWLEHHGLHPASAIRRELEARFTGTHLSTGPYYFSDLLDADAAAEQAAIDAGQLRAGCLRYTGRPRSLPVGRGVASIKAASATGPWPTLRPPPILPTAHPLSHDHIIVLARPAGQVAHRSRGRWPADLGRRSRQSWPVRNLRKVARRTRRLPTATTVRVLLKLPAVTCGRVVNKPVDNLR